MQCDFKLTLNFTLLLALPWLYVSLNFTTLYNGSTWHYTLLHTILYFTLLQSTLAILDSTLLQTIHWLHFIHSTMTILDSTTRTLQWLYLTLLYYSLQWFYLILLYSATFYHCPTCPWPYYTNKMALRFLDSTLLYYTLLWLYFTLLNFTLALVASTLLHSYNDYILASTWFYYTLQWLYLTLH